MTTTYVFYGEDRRHIEKGSEAYHGFRAERQALQRWHAMGAITWVLGGAAAPVSR